MRPKISIYFIAFLSGVLLTSLLANEDDLNNDIYEKPNIISVSYTHLTLPTKA